jgi:hypothetical protein
VNSALSARLLQYIEVKESLTSMYCKSLAEKALFTLRLLQYIEVKTRKFNPFHAANDISYPGPPANSLVHILVV